MSDPGAANGAPLVGWWVVLFPVTYAAHIAEEFWGGFAARATEVTGLVVPERAFLAANAVLWLSMCIVVALVLRHRARPALVVTLATIITINAAIHVGASLLWGGYAPGLFTGVLLWLPLGLSTLGRGYRSLPARAFRSGVLLGVLAHMLVPAIGLGFAVAFGGGGRAA